MITEKLKSIKTDSFSKYSIETEKSNLNKLRLSDSRFLKSQFLESILKSNKTQSITNLQFAKISELKPFDGKSIFSDISIFNCLKSDTSLKEKNF